MDRNLAPVGDDVSCILDVSAVLVPSSVRTAELETMLATTGLTWNRRAVVRANRVAAMEVMIVIEFIVRLFV